MSGYRNIAVPTRPFETVDGYVSFADRSGLLFPPFPALWGACSECLGPVGLTDTDEPFAACYHCPGYRSIRHLGGTLGLEPVIDAVLPATYSMTEGFESLLHQYKDVSAGLGRTERARIIGAVLAVFLGAHLPCVERVFGPISVATTVPPRVARPFRPMQFAIEQVSSWPVTWDHGLVERTRADPHRRGIMDGSYYALGPGRTAVGKTVLLVDDTWTSGSSLASVADRLVHEGAAHVIAVPVGRQINSSSTYGTSQHLRSQALARAWDNTSCGLCS